MKNIAKIIVLNAKKIKIDSEIDKLKPNAIKELRKMGYSYDKICAILGVGKTTAIRESNKKLLGVK